MDRLRRPVCLRGRADHSRGVAAAARRRLIRETIAEVNAFPLFGHPPARSVRWWMFDVLVAVPVALFSLPHLVHGQVGTAALAVLVVTALTVPLVVRRIWPSAVFGWLFVVSAAAGLWNVRLVVSLALVVALYTVAAQESRRRALTAAALLEGGVIVAAIRLTTSDWWQFAILGSGLVAAALGLGLYSATRRAYLAELHDRAERLERERDPSGATAPARDTPPDRRPPSHRHDPPEPRSDPRVGRLAGAGHRSHAQRVGHRAARASRYAPAPRRPASAPRPGCRRGSCARTRSRPARRAHRAGPVRGPGHHAGDPRGSAGRAGRGSAHGVPARAGGPHQHPQAWRVGRPGLGAPALPAWRAAGRRRR